MELKNSSYKLNSLIYSLLLGSLALSMTISGCGKSTPIGGDEVNWATFSETFSTDEKARAMDLFFAEVANNDESDEKSIQSKTKSLLAKQSEAFAPLFSNLNIQTEEKCSFLS